MDVADIDWIPEGTRFGVDEMTYFVGRGVRDFDEILPEVDLIITGPHGSGAFPAELQPFVDMRLTRRLQYDFTDISTSPVTRRWAQIDPRVLYIEAPHPRAARDANRARPDDLIPGLREAFARLDAGGPDGRPSLSGVDAVRPVTFGYLPVYKRPQTDDDWERLGDALRRAGALGIDEYERVRDDLVERVIEAKLRRLATIDPAIVQRLRLEFRHPPRRHVDARHDELHRPTRRRHLPRTPTGRPASGGRRAVQPRGRHR